MTQDFRVAMTACACADWSLQTPNPASPRRLDAARELRPHRALKKPPYAKITRHMGARCRSLCRWLRLRPARLCVTLDVRQLGKTGAATAMAQIRSAAVMDGFEVLRQLIDDASICRTPAGRIAGES